MKRFYSSCTAGLVKPINQKPIGYLVLPGFVGYQTGLEIQQHLVKRRHNINNQKIEQEIDDVICFLEHAPTFTAGRRLNGKSDQQEAQRLRSLGADYFETMRGGQITFHGPGQLIAYPILDIRDYQLNVRCYVSRLEKTIIDCCHGYNIDATTTENTGVWVGQDNKIAALGVQLQRYVSSHGIALNCDVDVSWFNEIVPCGLADKGVTSISKETGKHLSSTMVLPHLVNSFQTLFQKQLVQLEPSRVLSKELQEKLVL